MSVMCRLHAGECDGCGGCIYTDDPEDGGFKCGECGQGIYENDAYYDMWDTVLCASCVEEHRHIARKEAW